MKKIFYKIILIFSLALAYSCDNDFDILAEYEDVTIVYGLLNPDSVTYLRINKAFLGNESALIMAKVEDSSIYRDVEVNLEGWIYTNNDSTLVETIVLDTVTLNNKDTGIFYNPYQLVYFTNEPLNEDYTYKLNARIGADKIVKAQTSLIPDFTINRPIAVFEYVKFLNNDDILNFVEWITPENGKRFDVNIRFTYKEKSIDQDTFYRYFDWPVGTLITSDTEGNEEVQLGYKPANFYNFCERYIPYDDPAKENAVSFRQPFIVDFTISVADEAFNTYMEVNNVQGGISQIKPEYSNIENGLGLFAARYKKIRSKQLAIESLTELQKLNLKF